MAFKVLIVDDEPAVRRAMAAVLRRDGFEVITAGQPQEVPPADRFVVGIFDVSLSGRDGVGVARSMLDGGHVGQAIFYTGGLDEQVQSRADAVGTVILKPDLESLRAAVRRLAANG